MTQRNICTMNSLSLPIIIQFAFLILIPSVQAQTRPWEYYSVKSVNSLVQIPRNVNSDYYREQLTAA